MEATIRLIDLLGAGALLVWGLKQLKTGILSGLGAELRRMIALGTRSRLHAALTGLIVTVSMQSSTATAMITAAFAGRGLIGGGMAQAIMLGANLGTALAAAVLSLDLHWLASIFVLGGVIGLARARHGRGQGIGQAVLGLGLMLLSLRLMGEVTEPLKSSSVLLALVAALSAAPVLALLLAAGLAIAATSSLAVVLLVALLSQAGLVPGPLAVALVAGANIGGAIAPWLASIPEGIEARRLTLANLAVRATGGLLMTLLAAPVATALARAGLPLALPLLAHLAFNLALLAAFLPFVERLARLMRRLLPDTPGDAAEVRYLEEANLATPSLALAGAAREVLRMGDEVREMLGCNLEALLSDRLDARAVVKRLDDSIDARLQALKLYLMRLRGQGLGPEDTQRCDEVLSYAINLEHVGDIIDSHLSAIAEKRLSRQVKFSAEGAAELADFYRQTLENLQLAQSVFLTCNPVLARQLMAAKVAVRQVERRSSLRHLERIGGRLPEALDTSSMHLDILRDLKQINAHLATPAYPVLDRIGALRESRLRSPQPAES